ncbi:uncharacterized protein ARMOST_15264 [Armillaria ostoyae]|uniref:F-box domain-containing protein n=1 Tax=Armillaria ostoyae TaxID=47428 RepID=A0A284RSV8_ARMOS|nr:uncharacterized protein ARMOST_15264 [Armillaria ostoyae]
MAGYQHTDTEPSYIESREGLPPCRNWRADLQSNWNAAQSDSGSTPEVTLPMPDLPFDILGEVFGHIVPGSDDPYPLIHTASVCSSWRSASFDHPQLWGRIHLYPRHGRVHQQEQLLDLFLERSHDCGLSITLNYSPFLQRVSGTILARLWSQVGRWTELFITCLHPNDVRELLSPFPSGVSLSRLNTLTGVSLNMLNFQFGDALHRDSFPMDILLTAPRLHTLHAEIFEPYLSNTQKQWELPDRHILLSIRDLVVVPGKQERSLAASMQPGVGLLPFPHAQCAVIFPRHGYQTLIIEQTSNLISLTLCVSGYSSHNAITDAVRGLTLPLLRHLFIVYIGIRGHYIVEPGPLAPFIRRSSTFLETFVLNKVPMATKDVLDLLGPLLNLRDLTIREIDPLPSVTRTHFPITRELFNRLLQDHFLPNLRGIDLDWRSSVNASMYETLLTQVVRCRGLQKVRHYSRIGRIGGSRYAFENDLIPYFETEPMDLEPDESDPDAND